MNAFISRNDEPEETPVEEVVAEETTNETPAEEAATEEVVVEEVTSEAPVEEDK